MNISSQRHENAPMKLIPNKLDLEWSYEPWHVRALCLSDAYWESADLLFENARNIYKKKQEMLLPAFYLYSHALELFFKAALSFGTGTFEWTHNLASLREEWSKSFPSDAKQIPDEVAHFFRCLEICDPFNENCRYPHDANVMPSPEELSPILLATRSWMESLRKRFTDRNCAE
jgi:HEPN domain